MDNEQKEHQNVEEELAVYGQLRQKLSKTLAELHEKINPENVGQAMEKVLTDLRERGEHSREVITRAGETLKKDITSSVDQLKPKLDEDLAATRHDFKRLQNKGGALWREISQEAEYVTKLSLDKGGAVLLNVTRGLGEWSKSLSAKLDSSLAYRTGEITHGGEFTCTGCGGEIHLKNPGRLPPCPKCSKSDFRRS